ncbi:potassium channel subfamily K member 2-like isoform X2 [Branchiostoma floridae]|uniref:Potassium channel subfamily K member 2-like isoform X2 n=1 Tax=Branchiostoma floridae TaxID=7739 RepID=A0A9J7LWP7_BRAFL|nr:potassium channel subfamily K member 2-like isoform X2 [Branchiostoma floridae]
MNWKALLGLAISYIAVLLVGAAVFKVLEEAFSPPVNETATLPKRADLEGVLQNFSDHQNLSISLQELLGLIDAADEVRSVNVKYAESVNTTTKFYIDFFDSLFFCGTIITTIGYGHITPKTDPGKLFCIAYALIGIPITVFFLAGIGIKLGDANRWVEKKVKTAVSKLARNPGVIRIATLLITLLIGFGTFFFVPAYIFTLVEKWNYLDAIYYVFITLSTIGFGDMVTTVNELEGVDVFYDYLYKVAVIVWIMTGLTFLSMVIDLVQDGLQTVKEKMKDELDAAVNLDKFPGRNISLKSLKKKRGSKTESPVDSNSAVNSLGDDNEDGIPSEDNREKGIKETII